MLKKILLSLWLVSFLWVGLICSNQVYADDADNIVSMGDSTFWNHDNLFTGSTSSTHIWIDTIGTSSDTKWSLIQIIKNAINWVLGMLSLVALVLCLWWWFQIVTAAWDEWKQKKWVSVLKHAAIWLVVIWLSWFVVTIIFWLLRWVTTWTTWT